MIAGCARPTTNQEMVETSWKIRKYLKAHSRKAAYVQKLAVCGKEGVGKSTQVTLMANALIGRGYQEFVLDIDKSNPALYRFFGF
ncbi:MAG: hypothetical protein JRD68_09535 [Deltaproteobacteria bacterium]|nr:hypothetical protein [Deltaproteobacteria bacterium]